MSKNPIDDALEAKEKLAADKAAKHLDLWQTWNSNGRSPEHLEPLLKQFQPVINNFSNQWKAPTIPKSAMEMELMGHVVKAFETYNPNKGASLNTHVNVRVQKAKRYVVRHQNMAYIPEQKSYAIGPIQRAESNLSEELGRPPTPKEIADHLGMSVKHVLTTQKSLIRDIPGSAFESDPFPSLGSRQQEVLSMLPQVLSAQEKSVFDLVFHPTNPVTDTSLIAKRLGKDNSAISRIKSSIIDKIKTYT